MNLLRREWGALIAGLRFFTRIPLPGRHPDDIDLSQAARFFPLIGLLVGGIAALTFWAADIVWPKSVALFLSMVVSAYLTGALHEDGLADMVDGLGGGWDKTRVLEIMKDSRVGSFGVVALVLALLGKFLLLSELPTLWIPAVLVAGHAISRLCANGLMLTMSYARADDETAKARPVARLSADGFMLSAALILPACLLLPPSAIMAGGALAAAMTLWLSGLLSRKLGGYTGDCLGGAQQLSELAFYLGAMAALPR